MGIWGPKHKNVVFCKSKNWSKEYLEASTRPQYIKFDKVAPFSMFSKYFVGLVEILLFFVAFFGKKSVNFARKFDKILTKIGENQDFNG